MKIAVTKEIVQTMAGEVCFHTTPCPHGERGFAGGQDVARVGSVACQMCKNFDKVEEQTNIGSDVASESVICNYDKNNVI